MKHYIIVKFVESFDYTGSLDDIRAIFGKTLEIDGINAVNIKLSNSDRENRYDIMIEIDMEKTSLPDYDCSAPHKEWKDKYSKYISGKTIFDCD